MNVFTSLAFGLLIMAAPAIGHTRETCFVQQQTTSTASNTTTTSILARNERVKRAGNTHCPVGCMAVDAINPTSQVLYKGYLVGLCCNGCKRRFLSNPEFYLKKALGN